VLVHRSPRTYEVGEANRQLPRVRRLVTSIVELSSQLPELQDQLRIEEYRARRQGAGGDERRRRERAEAAVRGAEDRLAAVLRELDRLGVVLKDARVGLVDFYSYRDGELVELCWRLGEDRVAHWHRIGEGFAGRKPL
jgi:hypothetical protein